MLLTEAVFQLTMLPYVVVAVAGLVNHAVTAAPMLLFVMAVWACAPGRMRCAIIAIATQRPRPLGSREAAVRQAQHGAASPTASATAPNMHDKSGKGARCLNPRCRMAGIDAGPRRRMLCRAPGRAGRCEDGRWRTGRTAGQEKTANRRLAMTHCVDGFLGRPIERTKRRPRAQSVLSTSTTHALRDYVRGHVLGARACKRAVLSVYVCARAVCARALVRVCMRVCRLTEPVSFVCVYACVCRGKGRGRRERRGGGGGGGGGASVRKSA
jgi:hypothetical protein